MDPTRVPAHSEEQLSLLTAGAAATFRPVQYLGNKWRMREDIAACLSEIAPTGYALDLFTGSGVVAASVAADRSVIASDIQEYARVLASALLLPTYPPHDVMTTFSQDTQRAKERLRSQLSPLVEHEKNATRRARLGGADEFAEIVESGSIVAFQKWPRSLSPELEDAISRATQAVTPHKGSVMSRYYGGVYFSFEQAIELDALASSARALPPAYKDTLLACILSAASEVVSSVGSHFAQPPQMRAKDGTLKASSIRDVLVQRERSVHKVFERWARRYSSLRPATRNHITLCADYRSVLAEPPVAPSVIYADPPYTRDHYSRFYHVLETIAIGDEPGISVSLSAGASRGLYRVLRHQSPFSIASEVVRAFQDLARGARTLEVPLVLSYSPYSIGSVARPRPRLLTIDQLVAILREEYRLVEIRSPGPLAHSRLNKRDVNIAQTEEAELLLVGRL